MVAMVEFCSCCGSSLPKGDLTIKNGKAFTSPDYVCPDCHKPANPGAAQEKLVYPDPDDGGEIVVRDGKILKES